MQRLFDNLEIAAASQDHGGAAEGIGRSAKSLSQAPFTPRAASSRGVRICGIHNPRPFSRGSLHVGPHSRQVFDLPPPATSRPAWPGSA